MADDLDIDDLLNEVEGKYMPSKSSQAGKNQGKDRPSGKKSKGKSELDDMIDDIFDDDDLPSSNQTTRSRTKSSGCDLSTSQEASYGAGSGKKCFPVFIGGASCASGLATTINKRSCDRLRCTDCDFKVSIFDNYQWHSSVDYLFLRNNIPDFDRLKPKLVRKKGSRAYACQCKSRNEMEITDLLKLTDLKWVCGKH